MNELICLLTTVGATMTMTCNPKPAPTPIPTVTVVASPLPGPTVTVTATPVCPACPSPTPSPAPFVRAMWVSDYGATAIAAAKGSATRTTFFANLAAKQINRVFIESSAHLKGNRAQLSNFVSDAKAHGVETEFLINGPVANNTIATAFDKAVEYAGYTKTYQATYCSTGKEDTCAVAYQIDLEPHLYPEWSNLTSAMASYVAGITRTKAALGATKFSADVTNWYDQPAYSVGGVTFSRRIFDAGLDRMVLMNYTDSFSQMQARAAGEVAIACPLGKEVISGSDAINEGSSAASQALTFFEEGWNGATGMSAGWAGLKTYFAGSPCFKGVAGFDYGPMTVLK